MCFILLCELRTTSRREKGKCKSLPASQFIIPSHESRDCNLMSPTVSSIITDCFTFSVGFQIELFSGGMQTKNHKRFVLTSDKIVKFL